jgi:hypothetical protein
MNRVVFSFILFIFAMTFAAVAFSSPAPENRDRLSIWYSNHNKHNWDNNEHMKCFMLFTQLDGEDIEAIKSSGLLEDYRYMGKRLSVGIRSIWNWYKREYGLNDEDLEIIIRTLAVEIDNEAAEQGSYVNIVLNNWVNCMGYLEP